MYVLPLFSVNNIYIRLLSVTSRATLTSISGFLMCTRTVPLLHLKYNYMYFEVRNHLCTYLYNLCTSYTAQYMYVQNKFVVVLRST